MEDVGGVQLQPSDPIPPLVDSSCVSGSGILSEVVDRPLKSILLPPDVMDRYLEWVKKMRAELQRVAISDHEWWLKSFDLNLNGVIKLWCRECKKDCRGGSSDHTKAYIDNLFNNFFKSHIMSAAHVRNFYAAKNIDFKEHPQSQSKNGWSVTLTLEDQKRMIGEGADSVKTVNATLLEGHKHFTVLGNLEAQDTRCQWFKIMCQYCRDLMVLCPVQKNLEANLTNHISSPWHKKAVEDVEKL